MKVEAIGVAGTLESSDIMVTISPALQEGLTIELDSPVEKQFGNSIRATIRKALDEMGIRQAHVKALDKGALDCTVRARTLAAACRAAGAQYRFGGEH